MPCWEVTMPLGDSIHSCLYSEYLRGGGVGGTVGVLGKAAVGAIVGGVIIL